jgi:hypothetical protein
MFCFWTIIGLTFQYPELRPVGAPPLPSEQPYQSRLHSHHLFLVTKTRRICNNCKAEITESYQVIHIHTSLNTLSLF